MSEDSIESKRGQSDFANTRWTLVLAAGDQKSPASQAALKQLCETYWYPLYVYARSRLASRADAEDMTQAFFAEFLEKNFAATADPQRGRFRAFLLTALKNFMSKEWEKARAKKRGGDHSIFSLDFASADSQFGTLKEQRERTPDELFNRQWAITLLNRILDLLEQEHIADSKSALFEELKGFIIGDHSGKTYSDAAEALGMTTAAAKMAVSRMRGRYQALMKKEISQTVSENESVEDEIRSLFSALA